MRRKLFIYAALVVVSCGAAWAQSVQQVVADFTLLGTWAGDCNRPAAPDNIHTVYALSGRGVRRIYYDGPGRVSNEAVVTSAARISPDQILYDQELLDENRTRSKVVLTRIGDRIQVWLSQRSDGHVWVRDGRLTVNGQESPWQYRCRN